MKKSGGGRKKRFLPRSQKPEIYEKKKEPDHEKLREIYEKEIKKAQETYIREERGRELRPKNS